MIVSSHFLALSAPSEAELANVRARLAAELSRCPSKLPPPVEGSGSGFRWFTVYDSTEELIATLNDGKGVVEVGPQPARTAFLFPGHGADGDGVGSDLYDSLPRFRRHFDTCAKELSAEIDLVAALRDPPPEQTPLVLFALEYALAHTWLDWGVEPAAMIGHSLGEYAAASVAEVFSLADALAVIRYRTRLFESLPPGAMMVVPCPEDQIPVEDPRLAIAAINTPRQIVVSGPIDAIAGLEERLRARDIEGVRLGVPRAGHSPMVEPIIAALVAEVRQRTLSGPKRRFISNVTGDWASAAEVTDPAYWGRQVRSTVRFADGLARVLEDSGLILLEVGPGRTLSAYARQCPGGRRRSMLASMRHGRGTRASELGFLYETLGALWCLGVSIDWAVVLEQPSRKPEPKAMIAVERRVLRRVQPSRSVIEPRSRDETRIPFSPSQQPIWFLQRLRPDSRAYHFQARLRFQGRLDVQALRESLRAIIARHEIFRTTFAEVDNEPTQLVHDDPVLSFDLEELEGTDAPARRAEVDEAMAGECAKPFELARLPLVRWVLYSVTEEEHHLLQIEHHLVHDGWSSNLVFGELIANYTALSSGGSVRCDRPALQFADYALWHSRWCQTPAAATQLAFFREKMTPPPRPLALPFDHPRGPEQRFTGATLRVPVPNEVLAEIKKLSRACDATLYVVMLTGFMVLLSHYTGQDDVCVGCGVANRRTRELEEMVGMVVNIIALRQRLRPNATFAELIAEVRATALTAYANQDIPFSAVVKAAQPERVAARNPLFQVGFSFHETQLHRSAPGLEIDITLALPNGSSKFDMNIIAVIDASARLTGSAECTLIWEYDSDLFERSTMAAMSRRYVALLAAAAQDPLLTVRSISLDALSVSECERGFAQSTFVESATSSLCVHDLFSRYAKGNPAAPAVRFDGVNYSYGELEASTNRLARRLVSLGVGPECLVAVFAERSFELVLGELAVLKAGGGYLPIDPAYPTERARAMARDSGVRIVLCPEGLIDRASMLGARVVAIDSTDGEASSPPPIRVGPNNIAYIIYTSGSTGTPKGALIRHAQLSNLVSWYHQTYSIAPDDVASHLSGVGYDASVLEIWPALCAGACLTIPERTVAFHAASLVGWLREERVTLCFLSTPLVGPLLRAGAEDLNLRALLTGGEALHGIDGLTLPFPIVDHYGPTECTVLTTRREIPPDTSDPRRQPSIGGPIPNASAWVLDSRGHPQPRGVPGELALGGLVVGRGYLGLPALTATRFVPDVWSGKNGARYYLSGDVGRRTPGGEIEFLGRVDRQIKISGVRIEAGEVEAAVRAHPDVADALVITRPGPDGSLRLCAYYVSRGAKCAPNELRGFVRRTLPRAMTPEVFVLLEAFPLTTNAKVDRDQLPDPFAQPVPEPSIPAVDETELHMRLRQAWSRVLRCSFSIDDNFFDAGGSSLRMVELQTLLREALGTEIPIARLFEYPTVRAFADWFENRSRSVPEIPLDPRRAAARSRHGTLQYAESQRLARERARDERSG